MNRNSLTIVASALLLAAPLGAQQLEGQYRVIGSAVREAFEPLREVFQTSSAVLYLDRKPFGFGAVVSPDGYVLTKASELESREGFTVRIDREEYEEVTVVATSFAWDVALLKVDAEGLVPVRWVESADLPRGSWVVSNGATSRTRRRVRPGIIAANTRAIGGESLVVVGIAMSMEEDQVVVSGVAEGGGAEAAGLEKGDVILKADGQEIKERDELIELLKTKVPGDLLPVVVKRGDEELEFEIKLTARADVKDFVRPESRNDRMSGPVSQRRTNFPRILQHDTMLSERSVGGPLLDLDGRAVGLNIAYANRSESFAIPAEDARRLFEELKAEGAK